jgi:dTDP-3-amino-3,4,6-trideoxy-alpha-D-glucose transaminase
VGTEGSGGAFSFYPTKNLGALGDGGAVITNDAAVADRLRRLRNGGQAGRYDHVEAGVNSRLDEIQAAVLRARLPRLAEWTAARRALARSYREQLPPWLRAVPERDAGHVYHLFPVRATHRDALREHLHAAGIETLIHYPIPLTKQPAFASLASADCPAATLAATELVSLPLNPRLTGNDVARVAAAAAAFDTGRVLA